MKPKSRFNLRLTTPDDLHLETFDHTKLSAINTCPTWGILRYQMHKRMSGDGRAMALEAGSAMHECFSFIRLATLMNQYEGNARFQDKLWSHHGERLFGADRLVQISEQIKDATDMVDAAKRGSIAVLDTSGFYDDPRDRRRTLSNLEECIYAYVNRWRWDQRVWMRDPTDATSDIGIEIPFDVVVEIEANPKHVFRLTGRIDGIHLNTDGELYIADNKTASRLNDAWAQAFLLSHQITGYCVAASVFTGELVHKAEVLGLAIPLPKTYDFGGYMRETVNRSDYHYIQWSQWLEHTVGLTQEYANNPIDAPKYTHSCNRYFRPCSFIPFCDNNEEEQRVILSEMEVDEWSPLSKPVLDGVGNE
jgi:hypothetical protein